MQDRVIFETAKALKEAGFPQPKPESGQYWYHPHGQLYWIQSVEGEFCTVHAPNVSRQSGWIVDTEGWIFAPTATDILREMPGCYHLYHPFNSEFWICDNATNEDEWSESSNPAEAAALAYLQIKEHEPIPNH